MFFCGYSDHHNYVGCITKLQFLIKKPKKITYRSLKHFDENIFKRKVNMIPSHISNIFSHVGDQYCVHKYVFTEILNEHAPIKVRIIKENHVPYMHSDLCNLMYRRNMLKKLIL